MAFPWDAEENWEAGVTAGTGSIFTTEVDTLGRLNVVGPQDAHEIPPARGGCVLEVDLTRGIGSVVDAYIHGDPSLDIAQGTNKVARLMMYISDDFQIPKIADSVRIISFISGASTEEAAIGLVRGTKGELMLAIFSVDLSAWIRGVEVERNMWLPIEIAITPHTSAAKLEVHCLGSQVEASAMAWATLTDYRLGAISPSVDISGKLWFDSWVVDTWVTDADRLVAPQPLDPDELSGETLTITKSGWVFLGPGTVECLTLTPMTALDSVHLYDTDRLPYAYHDLRMVAKASAAETKESKGPKVFTRGCYAVLTNAGTPPTAAPSAVVQLGTVTGFGWGQGGEEAA